MNNTFFVTEQDQFNGHMKQEKLPPTQEISKLLKLCLQSSELAVVPTEPKLRFTGPGEDAKAVPHVAATVSFLAIPQPSPKGLPLLHLCPLTYTFMFLFNSNLVRKLACPHTTAAYPHTSSPPCSAYSARHKHTYTHPH